MFVIDSTNLARNNNDYNDQLDRFVGKYLILWLAITKVMELIDKSSATE